MRKISGAFILDCDFGAIGTDGRPLSRNNLQYFNNIENVIREIFVTKGNVKGKLRVVLFDVLFYKESVTHLPWSERRKILDSLPLTGALVKSQATIVRSKGAFIAVVKKYAKKPGSEGVVLKDVTGQYMGFGGTNLYWAKGKNIGIIKTRISDKESVKTPGVYSYHHECKRDGEWLPLGKTLNSKLSLAIGDIIEIQIEEVIPEITDEGLRIGFESPTIKGKVVSPAYTVVEIIREGKKSNILQTDPEMDEYLEKHLGFAKFESDFELILVGTGALDSPRKDECLLIKYKKNNILIDAGPDIKASEFSELNEILVCDPESDFMRDAERIGEKFGIIPDVKGIRKDGLEIVPFEVMHTNHKTYAYEIKIKGKKIIYAPEFFIFPETQIRTADLAILEGSAWSRPIIFTGRVGGHADILSTFEKTEKFGVPAVFTHIGSSTEEKLKEAEKLGIIIGYDGMAINSDSRYFEKKEGNIDFRESWSGTGVLQLHIMAMTEEEARDYTRTRTLKGRNPAHIDFRLLPTDPRKAYWEGAELFTPGSTARAIKIYDCKIGETKIMGNFKVESPGAGHEGTPGKDMRASNMAWLKYGLGAVKIFKPGEAGTVGIGPKHWAVMDGLGTFRWKAGIQDAHFKEFWVKFNSSSKEFNRLKILNGRIVATFAPLPGPEGEERRVWLFMKPKDQKMKSELF